MLTDEQVQSFRRNGFLNLGHRVLDDQQLDGLRAALDRAQRGESPGRPDLTGNISGDTATVVTQIVNIWEAEPAFERHLYNEAIVPMIAQLMGTGTVRVWHDQVQIKPPRIGGPTIWHQDYPYWPVLEPADLVSAWVALEDATIENGCMSMVRRSHLWGPYKQGTIGNRESDHGPEYDPALVPEGETVEVVPCEVKAGSVVFHHCLTWHGAPPNLSDHNRPAIAVHYMPGHTRYVPKAHHPVEHHIDVLPGEILEGKHFPTVMNNGTMVNPL